MRSKILVLAIVLATAASVARAQKRNVTYRSSSNYSSPSRSRGGDDNAKNSLTVGVVSWLNGYVPVHYERAVTSFLSLQVGAGVTFHSNFNDFGELVYEEGQQNLLYNTSDGYIDVKDAYYNYSYRNANLGYYASFSPRFYFRGNIMSGFTIAPLLEYKRFNYTAQLADATPGTFPETEDENVPRAGGSMKEHTNCLDLMLSIGGHYQAGHHIALAWSMGFGIRNMTASRLDVGYYTDPVDPVQYYVNRERNFKSVRPLLTFDFRIGGWF